MNRRRFLTACGALPYVSACGSQMAVVHSIGSAFEQTYGNKSAFDTAYALNLPYASVAVRQNNAPRALLVLGKTEGGEHHWISADRGVLVTRRGRLVQTVGLRQDLRQTQMIDPDFLGQPPTPGMNIRLRRQIDLMPGNSFGMLVEADVEVLGEEAVELLSSQRTLVKCRERCYSRQLDWRCENFFWMDPNDSQVWRSRQQSAPAAPELEIELVKPAAKA